MIFSQQENFQFYKINLYFFIKKRKGGKNFRNFSFGKKNKGRNSFLRKRNSMEQKKN